MIKTAADTIAAMIALYAEPGTWTREGVAWDADGEPVPADSPEAVAWSLEGALNKVIGDCEDPAVEWSECLRRQALLGRVFDACGLDLCMLGDAARDQGVVVTVLRACQQAA